MMREALREAIQRAGGVKALARHLNIASPAVSQWTRVPSLRVLSVEKISEV